MNDLERRIRAQQAGLAAMRAEQRRAERRKLEHVCPWCLEDMEARRYARVTTYRCRAHRFYRQVPVL